MPQRHTTLHIICENTYKLRYKIYIQDNNNRSIYNLWIIDEIMSKKKKKKSKLLIGIVNHICPIKRDCVTIISCMKLIYKNDRVIWTIQGKN